MGGHRECASQGLVTGFRGQLRSGLGASWHLFTSARALPEEKLALRNRGAQVFPMALKGPEGKPAHPLCSTNLCIFPAATHSTQCLLHKAVCLARSLTPTPDGTEPMHLHREASADVSGDGIGWQGRHP